MKKKYVITGLTVILLLISGVCYSCTYHSKASAELVSLNTDKGEAEGIQPTTVIDPLTQTQSVDNESKVEQEPMQLDGVTVIYVHICGAVASPGVYQAREGARLVDLIKLAGGLAKDAAGDYINQAQLVIDGQRIYIPDQIERKKLSTEELIAGVQTNSELSSPGSAVTTQESALININTADTEELMSISGIGKAKAASIIAYREKNGKFSTIEDLMNIPGIKEGLFNQISYMIVAK